MGDFVSDVASVAAPIAGAYFGGPTGAAIGSAIGGALSGGQQVGQANQQLGQAAQMSQFRPVGITNTFGTSKFGFDEFGRLNSAGYTLSPQLKAYQDQLAGLTSNGLGTATTLQGMGNQYLTSELGQPVTSLGSQYLGESPEAIRQRYVEQQNALLAPGQEQTLAGIRNNLFQTGRSGLSTGATTAGGLAATNPEMAAYYNSLANTQRQIAAGADTAAQTQAKLGADLYGAGLGLTQRGQTFGQGLLTGAYDPFKAGLTTQGAVEELGQQPFILGANLGGLSTAGSTNAGKYLSQQQNPWSTAASSLLSNPQFTQGIGNLFGNRQSSIGNVMPNVASWYDSSAQDF